MGANPVVYTIDFAETVVPGYLLGFLAANKADVAVTGIYDLVDLTDSDGTAANTTVKMVNGRQMQVSITGLTNGQEAALAITSNKFKGVDSSGVLTTNFNDTVAQRKVRVMLPVAGTYHAKIDTPAYSLLESGAVLLSGDFADATPAVWATDPSYVDYVVKITGSSSQINAYTLATGAWTAIVPAPANFGRVTLTATPTDIVNSAVAGTTPTVAVYVGQKPAVALTQLTTADTAPYATTFTNGIIVGHGQPGFSGTAGLPRDVDGTVNGTLDTAGGRIRTKIDIFGADPIANPATPPLITQKTIN
ncbi:MAG TPA: hypothetical protein DCS97_01715, partial [Planctomycetes bacterium]|nr:hypothetical protein [Planctomycetota bacterium]